MDVCTLCRYDTVSRQEPTAIGRQGTTTQKGGSRQELVEAAVAQDMRETRDHCAVMCARADRVTGGGGKVSLSDQAQAFRAMPSGGVTVS